MANFEGFGRRGMELGDNPEGIRKNIYAYEDEETKTIDNEIIMAINDYMKEM